jgi:hypothetical protein
MNYLQLYEPILNFVNYRFLNLIISSGIYCQAVIIKMKKRKKLNNLMIFGLKIDDNNQTVGIDKKKI